MTWLASNLGTIIVALVVFGAVAAAVIKMLRDKKAGKHSCSCGCGCESCALSGKCHGVYSAK